MKNNIVVVSCLMALIGASCFAGENTENLALGKPVFLIPNPNYTETVDVGDARQLTDGRLTEDPIWRHKSAVGWVYSFPRAIVDLGKIFPIEKIVVHAAGGGLAGVKFPSEIVCYASDDNVSYHEVARLTPRGLEETGKEALNHAFTADHLKTRGRYVLVTVEMGCSMAFLDEIEVWRGDFDPQSVGFDGSAHDRESLAFEGLGSEKNSYTRGHFPETPHVKWSLPLSGGPIKSILMNFSDGMRDVVEIAQRLDLDYVPVSHWSFYRVEPLQSLSVEQIEKALPDCRVMIVGAMQWQAFPESLLQKIKERIREGMGLICVTGGTKDWLNPISELFTEHPLAGDEGIVDLVPMNLIPGYRKPAKSHFQLSTFGKGRVALVNPADFTRPAHTILPTFKLADYMDDTNGPLEYFFLAFNKLVLWAAQQDTPHRIEKISASPEAITVEVKPGKSEAKLEVVVRDQFFLPMNTQEEAVQEQGGTFRFFVPESTVGTHAVDVWLRDSRGGILETGSSFFENKAGARITGITPAKPFWASGEEIGGTIRTSQAMPGSRLRLALYDTNDRLVAPIQEMPVPENGSLSFRIPYANPRTLAAKLFVEIWHDEILQDRRLARLWVDVPPGDDFTFLGWYALSYQPAAEYCMRLLRTLGVDGYVSLPTLQKAENGAYGNVPLGPEEIAFVRPPPAEDVGVFTPSREKATMVRLARMAREWRPFGVIHWSVGDEETLGREDRPPGAELLAEFRKHLSRKYETIQNINRLWKTSYDTWEDVQPPTLQEVKSGAPLSAWMAFRRFMESRFADHHAKARAAITEQIPSAFVGLSGTQEPSSFNGYDWWKLASSVDHVSGYVGLQPDLQRSFLRPGAFSTTFLGYDYADRNEQAARGRPWELLFSAARGINYYTLVSHTLNCPLLRSDLSMTRQGTWIFEEVAELKRGIGRLFMEAKFANDGIAIHYSPASLHAATAAGLFQAEDSSRNFWANVTCLTRILRDAHYQFDFLHEEQIAEGALAKYKVLILPWSSVISTKEAEAIRRFVENGGVLIADSYCGIRNEEGIPEPVLDDLFGIRQPVTPPHLFPVKLTATSDPLTAADEIPVTKGVPGIVLTEGVTHATAGSAPAVITHSFGKGRTIFLNASFSNYSWSISGGMAGEVQIGGESNPNDRAAIQKFFTSLLSESGIIRPIQISMADGASSDVRMARFSLGSTTILGVLWPGLSGPVSHQEIKTPEIHIPESHVYDARAGNYLGKTDTIQPRLVQGIAKVYTILPYQIEALTIQPHAAHIQQGETGLFHLNIKADMEPGTHVFHISVRDPSGAERPEYAKNQVGLKGQAEISIPFAFNDPPGDWKIFVRDVATGISTSTTMMLTARNQ